MSLSNTAKMLTWVQENPPMAMDSNTAGTIFDTWLSATRAPDDLLFLYPAIDITYNTLKAIASSDYDVAFFNAKCPETLSDWLRLFRHIKATATEWTTKNSIQSFPPKSIRKDRHPLYGDIEKYPVYASLMQYPEYGGDKSERYYRVLALLLVASILASKAPWRGQEKLVSREVNCGLATRKSALSREHKDYDNTVPALFRMADNVTWMLYQLHVSDPDNDSIVYQYRRFILDAFVELKIPKSGGGAGGSSGFHPSYGSWPEDYLDIDPGNAIDPADNAGPSPEKLIVRPHHRKVQPGTTPGELTGSLLLLCENNLDKTGRDRNDWSPGRQLHNFEMRNHYLPLHYDQLSPIELAAALNAVHTIETSEPTLITALQLVVLMGIPWTEIPKITVQHDYDIELISSTSFIINPNGDDFWIIPVNPPAYQGDHQFDPAVSRPHETWLKIPDSWGLGALISRSHEVNPFANYTEQALRKSARDLLEKAETDRRVTLAKLQNFFPTFLLTRVSHDPAIAAMLTQRELKGITQSHYTTLSEGHLTDYWVEAHTLLAAELRNAGYPAPARQVDDKSKTSVISSRVFVGSRLCPETRELQTVIRDLKTMLAKRPHSLSDRIEYHNTYTWYTALFCAYATGYRAVVDPIILGDQLDRDSKTAIICDKSHLNDAMARRVPVASELLEHLDRVKSHQVRMDPILRTLSPDPVRKPFYFIDVGRNLVSVTPRHLVELAPVDYPYPINANRRYIRSRFVKLRIPSSVTDAFLGHWTRSRAPHSKYGSADPTLLEETARSAIESLLDELGFEYINSMLIRV